MRSSFKTLIAGKAALAVALSSLTMTAAPSVASAQVGRNVVNCDAPGGRQATGAVIGGVLGGIIGSNVARNERTLGTVAGAAAGAAAGSYVGCKQQRDRANSYQAAYGNGYAQGAAVSSGNAVARTNLKIRSGPSTRASQVGSLQAGQSFQALGREGSWVRVGYNGQPVGYVSGAYVNY